MDQIWLQWWSKWGPNMNVISIPNRTIYDCNPYLLGLSMIAMSKFVLESRDYEFRTNREDHFWWLQSYLVIFEKDCNITCYSPIENRHYIHIGSSFWSSLQSYLVPMIKIIAIMCGPPLLRAVLKSRLEIWKKKKLHS